MHVCLEKKGVVAEKSKTEKEELSQSLTIVLVIFQKFSFLILFLELVVISA